MRGFSSHSCAPQSRALLFEFHLTTAWIISSLCLYLSLRCPMCIQALLD
ncbi:unnamed protein product [Amoebophrya sp. A25]|nr:unnamed protein product [Amoebophrya sp. A25]|eukprot:GSA25T00027526001.1